MRFLNRQPRPAQRRPARRRPAPAWLRPAVILMSAASVAVGIAGAVGWASQTAHIDRMVDAARTAALDVSARLGLTLQEVLVVGRHETDRAELLAAVGLQRGDTLLTFDVDEARARIEALPWVRSAQVERAFPDAIRITLHERRPLALWQNERHLQLIGHDGQPIRAGDIRRFRDLPILVGPDAPDHALALMAMLSAQPELAKRMTAAVRVGGRRWNLRLDGRVDLRLPEEDAAAAWARFGTLQREHRLLDRDVVAIDLRIADRMMIQLSPGAEEKTRPGEKSTWIGPQDAGTKRGA